MSRRSIPTLQAVFDYEHEHRFTEHELGVAERVNLTSEVEV
ncbi:MAG: hypothetical protein RL240_1704 [Planctomycetota bacterium]|jgi:hypothetical protein